MGLPVRSPESSEPNPVVNPPAAICEDPLPGRIYTPLPKPWIGIGLAVLCLLSQLGGRSLVGFVWLMSAFGSCYWLFCIHRIHKVLAEYTNGSYPISARRAVGFQFIPLFEYYWFFRWARQLARFFDQRSGTTTAPKVWPGILLSSASVLGWVPAFKSLRLFLIFGFGLYLTRKLKSVLPECKPIRLPRAQHWNLSMSAGVGAAFSFVLVQALWHFSAKDSVEKLHDLAAIFLVSIGVLIFLEPVFERLRIALGIAEGHPILQERKSWLLRLAAFLILVFASLFHGLLHSEIEKAIHDDWAGTIAKLLAGLVVSGGITYFWIGAAHRRPSHAARSGLISGGVLGLLVVTAVFTVVHPPSESAESGTGSFDHALHGAFPLVPNRTVHHLEEGELGSDPDLTKMLPFALRWPVLGLVGGLVIDRRWGGKAHRVALAMFAAAILYGAVLWLTGNLKTSGEIASHLSVAAGWGLALVVCSSSGILMPEERAQARIQAIG